MVTQSVYQRYRLFTSLALPVCVIAVTAVGFLPLPWHTCDGVVVAVCHNTIATEISKTFKTNTKEYKCANKPPYTLIVSPSTAHTHTCTHARSQHIYAWHIFIQVILALRLDWIELNCTIREAYTKHYLGAVADIAQKQNINRFYGHWYISVYQLISITQSVCANDNRFAFYSPIPALRFWHSLPIAFSLVRSVFFFLLRSFSRSIAYHVYFMSAVCQNRLNTQKPCSQILNSSMWISCTMWTSNDNSREKKKTTCASYIASKNPKSLNRQYYHHRVRVFSFYTFAFVCIYQCGWECTRVFSIDFN